MNKIINYCANLVGRKSPDFMRAIMLADVENRPKLLSLIALDIELYGAASASSEEQINQIKLAWWREGLDALFAGQVQAHSVLQALDESNAPWQIIYKGHLQDGVRETALFFAIGQALEIPNMRVDELINDVNCKRISKHERALLAMMRAPMPRVQFYKLALLGKG